MKGNGKTKSTWACAVETPHVSRPSGKEEVWVAHKVDSGGYIGKVVAYSAYEARARASLLYQIPLENIRITKDKP